METQEYHRQPYTISTDRSRIDATFVYEFLSTQTFWASNRTRDTMDRAIANSLNFGLYLEDKQIGYARVITDYATFAWVCDVFVVAEQRGHGLGKWLVECIINHPGLTNIRRLLLATRDASELYRKYGGFTNIAHVERWMEKFNPGV
jgi:GNAT superfamily N-acetyltransferase